MNVLANYDPSLPLRWQADASQSGTGAAHIGKEHPIAFETRTPLLVSVTTFN